MLPLVVELDYAIHCNLSSLAVFICVHEQLISAGEDYKRFELRLKATVRLPLMHCCFVFELSADPGVCQPHAREESENPWLSLGLLTRGTYDDIISAAPLHYYPSPPLPRPCTWVTRGSLLPWMPVILWRQHWYEFGSPLKSSGVQANIFFEIGPIFGTTMRASTILVEI